MGAQSVAYTLSQNTPHSPSPKVYFDIFINILFHTCVVCFFCEGVLIDILKQTSMVDHFVRLKCTIIVMKLLSQMSLSLAVTVKSSSKVIRRQVRIQGSAHPLKNFMLTCYNPEKNHHILLPFDTKSTPPLLEILDPPLRGKATGSIQMLPHRLNCKYRKQQKRDTHRMNRNGQ